MSEMSAMIKPGDLLYRAWIAKDTVVNFMLADLISPTAGKAIKERVAPWILAGHNPDRYAGFCDHYSRPVFENDITRWQDEAGNCYLSIITFAEGDDDEKLAFGFTGETIREITDEVTDDEGMLKDGWSGEMEIVGNVYANPEMMVSPANRGEKPDAS